MALSLQQLLKTMVDNGASDLHITRGSAPQIRMDGNLVKLKTEPLDENATKAICYSILTDAQKAIFEEHNELDMSFGIKGLARFRANIFVQQAAVAGAFRLIPFKIRSFNELGLPPVVSELCKKPRGLILVTGPTGSGKSTTLAAMIDKINNDEHAHIVTIDLQLPIWPFFLVSWIGDVSAVLLIAIRTYRLIFHPEEIHDPRIKTAE